MDNEKQERASHVSEDIAQVLASQIRANRLARGWTQKELSKRVGVTQALISRLETPGDQKNLNVRTLLRVASVLDVALIVRFVPFTSLAIPPFGDDHGQ